MNFFIGLEQLMPRRWAAATMLFVVFTFTRCTSSSTTVLPRPVDRAHEVVRVGMTVPEVIDALAGLRVEFKALGLCGPRGALNVGGKDGKYWAARGSPSGGDAEREEYFASPQALRRALESRLLDDGACTKVFLGFYSPSPTQFSVGLSDGHVATVSEPGPWSKLT